MDVLGMDERQRICWLYANRAVLFIVGIVWLCIIGWELMHQRVPYFMIVMVPVFAVIRFIAFILYAKRI